MEALARVAGVAMIVLVSTVAVATSPGPGAAPSEHDRAYRLGLEAYVYGLPLLTTDATFQTMTSVTVSRGADGPVNQFNHVRGQNAPGSTDVVAPGATSLSSIAWLDLTAEPQVLTVPRITGHHWMLALLDPWTENVAMLSSAAGTVSGAYVIAGPGQHDAAIPAGARRIDVDATRIWIIGSTQLLGPDDVPTVDAIQNGYRVTPLSQIGEHPVASAPAASPAVTTPTQPAIPDGLTFFDELGRLLADFPPPTTDAPLLARLEAVGIGPGLTPSSDLTLSSAIRQGLTDAVKDGPATVTADLQRLLAEHGATHNGTFLGGFGRYGTDYEERAVVSVVGLGAVVPEQAIYAMAWSDATGAPLSGGTNHVVHLAAPPPSREGWSLTVYDLQGRLVANALDRAALTDASPLTRNADGSVDILLGATQPTDAAQLANWLPTPAGAGFEVVWRLFAAEPAAIAGILDGSGWQPPMIVAR